MQRFIGQLYELDISLPPPTDPLWKLLSTSQQRHRLLTTYNRNLPNVPLQPNASLSDGQTSATYVPDRSEDHVPSFVSDALLDLHYVCLVRARNYGLLSPQGAILSSMGGRVPFSTMLQLADEAGYLGRILTLDWKNQSEPESVIGGYAEEEAKGRGPVSKESLRFNWTC